MVGRKVHISTFMPCSIKSIESNNAHAEQTLTCSSTAHANKNSGSQQKEEKHTYKKTNPRYVRQKERWIPIFFSLD